MFITFIESPVFCKGIKWNWEEEERKKDKSLKNHSLNRLMLSFYLGLQRRKKTTSEADKNQLLLQENVPERQNSTVRLGVKNK